MSGMDETIVLMYGTLKRGHSRNILLADEVYIGDATTVPDYRLYDLGAFPALRAVTPGKGKKIQGELWRVSAKTISLLDRIEGSPHFYKLLPINLESPDNTGLIQVASGELKQAKAYLFQQKIPHMRECGVCWP
jgi:gamma-glutamylaminecyclotransferase